MGCTTPQGIPPLPATYPAGDHHLSAVDPRPGIHSWNQIRVTIPTESSAEVSGDADAVAHGDPTGEEYIPVGELGIIGNDLLRTLKQDPDPFPCYLRNIRTSRLYCHFFPLQI
jgi:hypothetical protein